jgi:hypothetical protein
MRASRSFRRAIALMLAAVTVALVALVPASPAMAACWSTTCTGEDPMEQGCLGGDYIHQVFGNNSSTPAWSVALRYHAGCGALWARAVKDCTPSGGDPPSYARIERMVQTPYGWYVSPTKFYSGDVPCGGPAWTRMIGDESYSDKHRACVASPYSWDHPSTFPESSWWLCTIWW